MNVTVKPFVKWAGGKSQLLSSIRTKYPVDLGQKTNKFCEPFVGGGAVLFDILSNYKLKEILINDINAELINTYRQIQNHVTDLLEQLEDMQNIFWPLNKEDRKKMYLKKRERFNFLKVNGDERVNVEKAALFIFLNKTCFNGLFRVNKNGLFNVPMGAYKKPLICDKENLLVVHKLLQGIKIFCGDYRNCLKFIDENTFVYIDPPYRPLTETASFTAYSENMFDDSEQIALGRFVDQIHEKGAKIVVSNSDPKNADQNDDFFDKLYSKYKIERVSAKRMINCNGENRGNINELLISNYCV
ncbi:MAG: DNA adenine methylase [Elusimicrobiota bacterium]|nr:DNA adenine methylase [Elusimicrobiota bacterium]